MPSADLDASLAERLGGRWAMSWQGFVISVPLAVGVIALSAQASADAPTWLLIAVVAVAVSASWAYLMHRTVFRDRAVRSVALPWVIATTIVIASLYVGTAVILGLLLDVLNVDSAAAQFVSLWIVAVFGGLLLTLVLDSQWRFRVQREELIQQEVQQQLASAQELDVLRDIRESVLSEIGQQVKTSSADLMHRIDDLVDAGEADVGSLAQELRDTADRTVRPLSHELEDRARRKHRTPGFLPALVNIVRYQPFRPVAVSIVYLVTATVREINLHGWTIGVGLLVTTVAFIFAIMLPLNQAMNRWPSHHVPIYLVGLVLIQAPTLLLSPLREQVTGEVITAGTLVTTALFGSIVVIGTSAFGSWNRTRKEVIADFQREVNEDAIATLARGEALAKATMDAALVLHGSVQSQLHACAMAIEEAARNGDMVEVNRALMQARAILAQPDLDRVERQSRSLAEIIDAQIAQWSGLLTVVVNVDPSAEAMSGIRAEHVADLVEEAIANAVHHGAATKVSVRIAWEGEDLTITVRDNGSGPGKGAPGLGSRLFSSFGGRWELDVRSDGVEGSVLTICLPTSHAAESFSR